MQTTRFEVALVAWPPRGGTQIVGRSADPDLVDAVRERLVRELEGEPGAGSAPLRVLRRPNRPTNNSAPRGDT